MNTQLRQDILTETYKDMKGLLIHIAKAVYASYGGDLDDLISQASLIFLEVLGDYDVKRAGMSTFLTITVSRRLFYYARKNLQPSYLSIDDVVQKSVFKKEPNISVMDFLDEFSSDALVVLSVFFETPKEIFAHLSEGPNLQYHMRNRIKNKLRQMQWTTRRIKKTFREIAFVLKRV